MQCPFCAEEIRDDALVCKHCSHDLKIPAPLIEEHAELTAKLAELQQEVHDLRAELDRVRGPFRLWAGRSK
jgi:hypothetical protein